MKFNAWLLTLLAVGLFPSGSMADTTIVDERGLTRAIKGGREISTVIVNVAPVPAGQSLSLTNVDGLKGDIKGEIKAPGSFIFKHVSEGTWQIKTGHPVTVISVEVQTQSGE